MLALSPEQVGKKWAYKLIQKFRPCSKAALMGQALLKNILTMWTVWRQVSKMDMLHKGVNVLLNIRTQNPGGKAYQRTCVSGSSHAQPHTEKIIRKLCWIQKTILGPVKAKDTGMLSVLIPVNTQNSSGTWSKWTRADLLSHPKVMWQITLQTAWQTPTNHWEHPLPYT